MNTFYAGAVLLVALVVAQEPIASYGGHGPYDTYGKVKRTIFFQIENIP